MSTGSSSTAFEGPICISSDRCCFWKGTVVVNVGNHHSMTQRARVQSAVVMVKVSEVKMKRGKCCHCLQKRRKIHHNCCIHCHCFSVFICCWCPFSFNLWLYTTPGSSESHQIARDFTNSTQYLFHITLSVF